jgi:hypothetical protein
MLKIKARPHTIHGLSQLSQPIPSFKIPPQPLHAPHDPIVNYVISNMKLCNVFTGYKVPQSLPHNRKP